MCVCLERQRKAIKKKIRAAIASQDYTALDEAVQDALELDMKDDPDVIKGQQVLDYVRCSERKKLCDLFTVKNWGYKMKLHFYSFN